MSTASIAPSASVDTDPIDKIPPHDAYAVDIEQKAVEDSHLMNDTVRHFAWQGVTVTVKEHGTKLPKTILEGVNGIVKAG